MVGMAAFGLALVLVSFLGALLFFVFCFGMFLRSSLEIDSVDHRITRNRLNQDSRQRKYAASIVREFGTSGRELLSESGAVQLKGILRLRELIRAPSAQDDNVDQG